MDRRYFWWSRPQPQRQLIRWPSKPRTTKPALASNPDCNHHWWPLTRTVTTTGDHYTATVGTTVTTTPLQWVQRWPLTRTVTTTGTTNPDTVTTTGTTTPLQWVHQDHYTATVGKPGPLPGPCTRVPTIVRTVVHHPLPGYPPPPHPLPRYHHPCPPQCQYRYHHCPDCQKPAKQCQMGALITARQRTNGHTVHAIPDCHTRVWCQIPVYTGFGVKYPFIPGVEVNNPVYTRGWGK